ncbi:MAG: hypothetical protein Ct9H300mP4_10970 [Gammaproteobacteria bacterium]|nr:MAG: hypothetical protein Ct9H300mP4_10970 [Gammaproteobacteria bacterium]
MSDKKTLIMMSSDLGSVYQNTFGGLYSYRASKSGLNWLPKECLMNGKILLLLHLHQDGVEHILVEQKQKLTCRSVEDQQKMFEFSRIR